MLSYARVATMVDGTGTTTYAYQAISDAGAGQVASVDGPMTNDTISYTYDELGRVICSPDRDDREQSATQNTVLQSSFTTPSGPDW